MLSRNAITRIRNSYFGMYVCKNSFCRNTKKRTHPKALPPIIPSPGEVVLIHMGREGPPGLFADPLVAHGSSSGTQRVKIGDQRWQLAHDFAVSTAHDRRGAQLGAVSVSRNPGQHFIA